MRVQEVYIGTTEVVLDLHVYSIINTGVTGLSPKISIRRCIDSYYLDFDDMTFKSSLWVLKEITMNEVGFGVYSLSFDSSSIITVEGEYAVVYDPKNVLYTVDIEYLRFKIPIEEIIIDGVTNPTTLKTALKEILSYTTSPFTRNVGTGAITYKDRDGGDTFTLTPGISARTRS